MPSSDHLVIDTAAVMAVAAGVGAAATAAPARPVTIAPSAADTTSVGIANALAGLVSGLVNATAAANAAAAAAAGRLAGASDAYDHQEQANARGLAATGGALAGAAVSSGPPPAWVPPPALAVPTPAGVTPTTGRQAAALIHAGVGPGPLLRAATLLGAHAEHLDDAARQLRSARWECEGSWDSPAAVSARRHLVGLETAYTDQAERARDLARHANTQADNFRRAASRIPHPQLFDDLEQRLKAAGRANAAPGSMGRFSGVVAHYQARLAEANTQAVEGFTGYSQGAGSLAAAVWPVPVGEPSTGPAGGGAGVAEPSGPPAPPGPDGAGAASPPAADGGPVELAGLPGAPAGGADLLAMALPAVLGGVAGLAGGLLGALSGAGQKVQEAVQAAGGVAQGAVAALGTPPGAGGWGGRPISGGDFSGGGGAAELGGAGGDFGGAGDFGGGTEPAGGYQGPLAAAPAAATAAPGAAPALYSPAAATTASGAGVAGAGGLMGGAPMMAPPMSGAAASGAGEDRRLYPERKLKVQTPPNSEPVWRRREDRGRSRAERGGENP